MGISDFITPNSKRIPVNIDDASDRHARVLTICSIAIVEAIELHAEATGKTTSQTGAFNELKDWLSLQCDRIVGEVGESCRSK